MGKSDKKVDLKRKRPHGKCRNPDVCAHEDQGLCTVDDECEWREQTSLVTVTEKTKDPAVYIKFDQKTFDAVCDKIEEGYSLRDVCKMEGMPCVKSVRNWVNSNPALLQQYTRSIEDRTELSIERMLKDDDKCIALVLGESKDSKRAGAIVQSFRGKADDTKWAAAKMAPKTFGTHTDITSGGKPLMPTLIINTTNENTANFLRDLSKEVRPQE